MINYKKMSDQWYDWRYGDKEKLNEGAKRIEQKTRFGTIEIVHAENPTAPGYDPEYVIDVKIGGNYLASILIEGDPRDNPYLANVKVQTHRKRIKVKAK